MTELEDIEKLLEEVKKKGINTNFDGIQLSDEMPLMSIKVVVGDIKRIEVLSNWLIRIMENSLKEQEKRYEDGKFDSFATENFRSFQLQFIEISNRFIRCCSSLFKLKVYRSPGLKKVMKSFFEFSEKEKFPTIVNHTFESSKYKFLQFIVKDFMLSFEVKMRYLENRVVENFENYNNNSKSDLWMDLFLSLEDSKFLSLINKIPSEHEKVAKERIRKFKETLFEKIVFRKENRKKEYSRKEILLELRITKEILEDFRKKKCDNEQIFEIVHHVIEKYGDHVKNESLKKKYMKIFRILKDLKDLKKEIHHFLLKMGKEMRIWDYFMLFREKEEVEKELSLHIEGIILLNGVRIELLGNFLSILSHFKVVLRDEVFLKLVELVDDKNDRLSFVKMCLEKFDSEIVREERRKLLNSEEEEVEGEDDEPLDKSNIAKILREENKKLKERIKRYDGILEAHDERFKELEAKIEFLLNRKRYKGGFNVVRKSKSNSKERKSSRGRSKENRTVEKVLEEEIGMGVTTSSTEESELEKEIHSEIQVVVKNSRKEILKVVNGGENPERKRKRKKRRKKKRTSESIAISENIERLQKKENDEFLRSFSLTKDQIHIIPKICLGRINSKAITEELLKSRFGKFLETSNFRVAVEEDGATYIEFKYLKDAIKSLELDLMVVNFRKLDIYPVTEPRILDGNNNINFPNHSVVISNIKKVQLKDNIQIKEFLRKYYSRERGIICDIRKQEESERVIVTLHREREVKLFIRMLDKRSMVGSSMLLKVRGLNDSRSIDGDAENANKDNHSILELEKKIYVGNINVEGEKEKEVLVETFNKVIGVGSVKTLTCRKNHVYVLFHDFVDTVQANQLDGESFNKRPMNIYLLPQKFDKNKGGVLSAEHKVVVEGTFTKEELKKNFRKYGIIVDIRRMKSLNNSEKKWTVAFLSTEGVNRCLEDTIATIEARPFSNDDNMSVGSNGLFSDISNSTKLESSDTSLELSTVIMVDNLPIRAEDVQIINVFEDTIGINTIKRVKPERGSAFVEFKEAKYSRKALKMDQRRFFNDNEMDIYALVNNSKEIPDIYRVVISRFPYLKKRDVKKFLFRFGVKRCVSIDIFKSAEIVIVTFLDTKSVRECLRLDGKLVKKIAINVEEFDSKMYENLNLININTSKIFEEEEVEEFSKGIPKSIVHDLERGGRNRICAISKILGTELTENHLLEYFSKYGFVRHISIQKEGRCFVDFTNVKSAMKACEVRLQYIRHNSVEILSFVNVEHSFNFANRLYDQIDELCVFKTVRVLNVGMNFRNIDLRNFFGDDKVVDLQVSNRGNAIVEFGEYFDAHRAINEKNGRIFNGNRITIDLFEDELPIGNEFRIFNFNQMLNQDHMRKFLETYCGNVHDLKRENKVEKIWVVKFKSVRSMISCIKKDGKNERGQKLDIYCSIPNGFPFRKKNHTVVVKYRRDNDRKSRREVKECFKDTVFEIRIPRGKLVNFVVLQRKEYVDMILDRRIFNEKKDGFRLERTTH